MYSSKKQEVKHDLIDDGSYVATAEDVSEVDNFDGSEKLLQIKWRLENNRVFFDKIHHDKNEPTDYNHFKVSNILNAIGGSDCNTTADLIKEIKGKKAQLKIVISTYNGKAFNKADSYSAITAEAKPSIDTDDLPF